MKPVDIPIICLMGPTASGKTPLAVELVQRFPCEIISVDSAMVYRGMDIGTAKPNKTLLQIAPHHLINLLDPKHAYSAGQFRSDAVLAIQQITARGKVPLLVGGTMLYFRVLQQGIAKLPKADKQLRVLLQARIAREGLTALHAELARVDPVAAKQIAKQDNQRIQRALEVYLLTGKAMSTWQKEETIPALDGQQFYNIALMPNMRSFLHERIAQRFSQMLAQGFIDEVRNLYERGDLTDDLPAIRSVGYRQMWDYFSGRITYREMEEKTLAATRQLAKRQMTWLRSWPHLTSLSIDSTDILAKLCGFFENIMGQAS